MKNVPLQRIWFTLNGMCSPSRININNLLLCHTITLQAFVCHLLMILFVTLQIVFSGFDVGFHTII